MAECRGESGKQHDGGFLVRHGHRPWENTAKDRPTPAPCKTDTRKHHLLVRSCSYLCVLFLPG